MVDDNKMMTLTYFDLMGRAEAARMVLTHGQVEFHDHRVSGESWAAFKASDKCPSGQLPVLEDEDGVCMHQSQAITRYGLLPRRHDHLHHGRLRQRHAQGER
mmetsp:Transcript_34122/g.38390  ORF Transcript_34122/g.38390 Transcript_34122/m.38390 type:complete len:102 (+) Transcript_34122:64-369(+)